jgi:hypothetical protein
MGLSISSQIKQMYVAFRRGHAKPAFIMPAPGP